MKWVNLEPVMQSTISQKENQILYIGTYICNLERCYTYEPKWRT